jgi:ABC-2 type transport system ATP-binding protein
MVPLLQARHLSRRFGAYLALRDVSLTLRRGEVLGFLGANGAGKSTCLRILSGALQADTGQVCIAGIDLAEQPLLAKAKIGYLPEQPPLYLNQRVDEYLQYALRLHRVGRRASVAALRQVKRRCGLETVGRRLLGKLSKGYRQRVGIAQAIAHQPPLIILDEPSVGLDPGQSREIRDLIGELGHDHGVLVSTHLLPEAQAMCQRVLILHQGRLVHEAQLDAGDAAGRELLIGLEQPPGLAQLHALPGVIAVDDLDAGRFRLRLAAGFAAAELARHAVQAGWGLRELTPQRADLEQVFLRLTSGTAA